MHKFLFLAAAIAATKVSLATLTSTPVERSDQSIAREPRQSNVLPFVRAALSHN